MRGDSVKIKNCSGGFKICGESIRKIYLGFENFVYGNRVIIKIIRRGIV